MLKGIFTKCPDINWKPRKSIGVLSTVGVLAASLPPEGGTLFGCVRREGSGEEYRLWVSQKN